MRLHPLTAPLEALRIGFLAGSFAFFLVGLGLGFVPFFDVGLAFVLFPVGFALGAGYAIARYLLFDYELTADTLDIASGVIARQHCEIPIQRVQNLDIERSLLQRLVGLAVVTVETAGGGESEAELKFVSYESARSLQSGVQTRKRATREPTVDEGPSAGTEPETVADSARREQPETEPLFALSPRRLALLGVSSVDLNTMGVFVFLGGLVGPMIADGGIGAVITLFANPSNIAIGLAGAAIINAAVAVSRHYDFVLVRVGNELRYEHGLFNRRSGSIPIEKPQRVALHENILMRRLGFATLTVETAGYAAGQNRSIGSQTAVPIARRAETLRVMRAIEGFGVEIETTGDGFARPPKRARRRYAGRYSIAIVLVTGGLYGAVEVLELIGIAWYAPLSLLVLVPIAAHLKWLHRGYRIEDEHVLTRNGFWRRSIHVVPYYRLQTASQHETVFQRRWGLATVVIDTAGSFATRFSLAQAIDIDAGEAESLCETVRERLHERIGIRSDPPLAADGNIE